jgi:DNA-binding NarL/FixJ family response regulator
MSMRVLLADDHALVRTGIRLVLTQIDPTLEIFEAADGRVAIDLARRESPDLCLLDISMPGLNGIDAIPLLLKASPRTRILVLSMHSGMQYVSEALRAGAHGYILKDAAVDEVADALRAVREGRPFLSQQLADTLLTDYARRAPGQADSPRRSDDAPSLSPRQREVLQRIAEGRSTREIAAALHVSVKTVETHRAEIMRRLDIRDVAGLTRYAIRHGMVAVER